MVLGKHSEGRVFGLYLKLSAWLIPTFLFSSIIGLHFLSKDIVEKVEDGLSARIGTLSARVASGLEYLGEEAGADGGTNDIAARQIMKTLLADPAILCSELLPDLGGNALMVVPEGLGCRGSGDGKSVSMAIYYGDSATLTVKWSDAEVAAARANQRETSLVILMVGLVLALLANWLAFRVIIGRPLKELIERNEKARSEAEYNALHDPLTGLANRRQLDREMTKALAKATLDGAEVTLMHLDLDGFKAINDTMGHAAGDKALGHVSNVLKAAVEPQDLVARIGGDEFVVLLGVASTGVRAERLATDILAKMSEKLTIDGEIYAIGASIGIAACSPEKEGMCPDDLLRDADVALYQAKEDGKGRYVVCTEDMRQEVEQRKTLASEIEEALAQNQFVVHYQPIFDRTGTEIVGAEALVRWLHPARGLLMPGAFVEVAKELHLIDQIDRLVLEQALREIPIWDRENLGIERVAVNVSARRLNAPNLIDELRKLKIPHGRLVFEVVEAVYLDQQNKHLAWNLEALGDLGVEIEIDDFGSGRASIGSILAIRPARLKLAREIIGGVGDVERDAVIEAVVGLGRSLNIGLVAQGVETEAQLQMVRAMDFELIQGFALAQPMTSARLIQCATMLKLKKFG